MRRLLLTTLALVSTAFAGEPVKDVFYLASFFHSIPKFDQGYVFEIPKWDDVLIFGRDGGRVCEPTLTWTSGVLSILDAAADTHGGFAVSLVYRNEAGERQGAIAFLDPSCKQIRTVETGRYVPAHVCFAPSGELWALGEERTPDDFEAPYSYMIFRKYGADGKETGRFVSRSTFPGRGAPGGRSRGIVGLQAGRDRMGALLRPASKDPLWIEIDFSGKLLGQWKLGRHSDLVALTAKGELYTVGTVNETAPRGILRFDRKTSSWSQVEIDLPNPDRYGGVSFMMGAEGDSVVVKSTQEGRLLWLAVKELPAIWPA